MSTKPRCENCTAWELVKGYWGFCKALPPIALGYHGPPPANPNDARWPRTRDGDWCRDGYQAKE